jgi:hypothetical protein
VEHWRNLDLGLEVDLEDLGQVRLDHFVEETRLGARVAELAAAIDGISVLAVKFDGQLPGVACISSRAGPWPASASCRLPRSVQAQARRLDCLGMARPCRPQEKP